MKRIGLKWAVIGLIAAAAAALVGGRATHVSGASQIDRSNGTVCTTCLSISAPASPVLYPGAAPSSVPVTFTNNTNGPIYVTTLQVNLTNSFQTGCLPTEFQFANQTFSSGTNPMVTVQIAPAETIPANSSWTDPLTLSMPDDGTRQDACQGQPLSLSYTGSANYTVLTTTTLAESTNTSTDTATFTATVAPDILPVSAGQTPGPTDGSVTFYQCAVNSSSATDCTSGTNLGTSGLSSSGVATLSIPAGSVGSYTYQAVYTPPAGSTNFLGSTSPIVTSNITGCVNVQLSGATVWKSGYVYSGNYTVPAGTTLWLQGATINGNVTVPAGAQFASTGGAVNGSVTSSGGPVAMSATTVTGNVQSSGGGLSIGPTTVIKGNVQPGGGPFCSQGASLVHDQVQIRGNLTVQYLSSSTTSTVSNTIVGNNLQWQYNSSPGVIGSSGGNNILGNLIVQYNTGKVTVGSSGAPNSTTGNIIVGSNTGGGTITGNSASGNCLLSGDKPPIVGSGNTASPKGQNQCNAAAGA